MTSHNSDYLRIYSGEPTSADKTGSSIETELTELDGVFQHATGWSLFETTNLGQVDEPLSHEQPRERKQRKLRGGKGKEFFVDKPAPSSNHAANKETPNQSIQALGQRIAYLYDTLNRTRQALWQREAELSTSIPVVAGPDPQQWQLAARLEMVLKGGADAVDCQAAGLYLLDDATSCLKLRSQYGLAPESFLDSPRPLDQVKGDLEALSGHVVAMEDTSQLPHWNIPVDYPAAICVPVATPNALLGTLWFFSSEKRDFLDHETNIAEIVAGRVAADLEREVLLRSGHQDQLASRQVAEAVQWQLTKLPTRPPLVDGWEVAGISGCSDELCGEFYDWFLSSQGTLAVTLYSGHDEGLIGSLAAFTMHGALQASRERLSAPSDVVNRLNETAWHCSSGDRAASMFQAVIDPATGLMRFSTAGYLSAYLIRTAKSQMISLEDIPLGVNPSYSFETLAQPISRGEAVLIVGHRASEPRAATIERDLARSTAEILSRHLDLSARQMADMLREDDVEMEHFATQAGRQPVMMIVKRRTR